MEERELRKQGGGVRELKVGKGKQGRPNRRLKGYIKMDMEVTGLKEDDTPMNSEKWRRATRNSDLISSRN